MLTSPPDLPIPDGVLRIGDVSTLTGLSLRSIRHYEDLALVQPARRTAGGFREYDAEAVQRLRLVMHLRLAGLGLEELGAVVDLCRQFELGHEGVDPAALDDCLDVVDQAARELELRLEATRRVQQRLRRARGGRATT